MEMLGDSDIEFVLPEGADSVEAPLLIDTTMTVDAGGASVNNNITQTGTLFLQLSRTGTAKVELRMDEGTQDIFVQAAGRTVNRGGSADPYTSTFDLDMQQASCDG